jgi:alpha-mannosidase
MQAANVFKSISVTGSPSLILDVVKRGEDDEDVSRGELPKRAGKSIILRIYESLGGRSRGTIHAKFPVKEAWKCNVLEDNEGSLEVCKGDEGVAVKIELRAFEVATYRLQL